VSTPPNLLVVIPTFKEVENLHILLPALAQLPLDVLVVDDASNDGTRQWIDELRSKGAHIDIYERGAKLGLGSAYKEAFTKSLTKSYDGIIQMDADGSHRVEDLSLLIKVFHENPEIGLIIGSRWIPGGAVKNWSKHREYLSRIANFYSRIMLGFSVRDSTAGFRIYRTSLLHRMRLARIESEG
jgi:dolichol-phosphate mannosyltransferase